MELTKETSLFKKDAIKDDVIAAGATATDYIEDVSGSSQTGMTLQPVSNAANNYIQLDSDGLEIYKGGQLIASYGQAILLYHPGVTPLSAAVEITPTSARFTGQIQADSGYIGGWSIGTDNNKSLHNGAANVSPVPGEGKVILSKGVPGTTATGNLPVLPNGKAWAFTAGNQFGVTTDGDLYASAAHLEGLSVGNYSDSTTNLLYGNCVWTNVFAEYFKTDLANSRHTYQGWTAVNTGNIFSFDSTNNWLVVDYSDHTTEAILQQNTGIVAPETTFTVSANLGTDCKVVFGGVEISGTDWQTADDGRKYATFTTTASATSGVFEIWPVASENYIFKGNRFKLEKSDLYSSWTTLDEQINKTGGAIGASSEATSSYFLNFTSTGGLKIAQTDPAQATTNYIQITDNGVKTIRDSTHFSNLTSDGLKIYSGNVTYPVASFGSAINLYQPGTAVSLVSIDGNGAHFTGEVIANGGRIGGANGWLINTNTIESGTVGATNGIKLSTANYAYSGSIGGGSNRSDWKFTIGSKFGVTADGTLYANQAVLSGLSLTTDIIQSGSNYAWISDGGLDIVQGGVSVASYGAIARIGTQSGYYTTIAPSSFSILDGGASIFEITPYGGQKTKTSKVVMLRAGAGTNTISTHISGGETATFYFNTESNSVSITFPGGSTDDIRKTLTSGSRTLVILGKRTSVNRDWTVTLARSDSTYAAGRLYSASYKVPLLEFAGTIEAEGDIKASGTIYSNNTEVSLIHTHNYLPLTGGTVSGKITCTDCAVNNNLTVSNNLNVNDIYKISGNMVTIHDNLVVGGLIRPGTDNKYSCGSDSYHWTKVYAKNGSIDTSDRKEKDILGSINFAKTFIMNLKPIQYMWKDGDHRRIRMGFVAQDIAEKCKQLGLNLSLYSASYKLKDGQEYGEQSTEYYGEEVDDKLLTWGLAYSQLIAPIVQVIQDQQKEIEQLKKDIHELKNK